METAQGTPARPDKRWAGAAEPIPAPVRMPTMTRDEVASLWGVTARVVTRYVARGVLTRYVRMDGRGVRRIVFSAAQAKEIHAARQDAEASTSLPADPGTERRKRW